MSFIRELFVRVRAHLRPTAADQGINEEMRYHLERLVEQKISSGMSPDDARDAARREFGNVGASGDDMRDAARWAWLSRIERDVRYALRSLRRSPIFAMTVILTIAVAIGLNASVFTFLNAYVLQPFTVNDPSALHAVRVVGDMKGSRTTDSWMYWNQYERVRDDSGAVSDALMTRDGLFRINQVPSLGAMVSANYFSMLGVNTVVGRPILPEDLSGEAGGFVVVLSHAMWRARFGGDSGVIGSTVPIRGHQFTIIGVAKPDFTGLSEVPMDFWVPITVATRIESSDGTPTPPSRTRGAVIVRLRPGVTPASATDRIGRTLARYSEEIPGDARVVGAELESRATILPINSETIAVLTPVAIAFFLVLAVACANVANMMLARGIARQRELGIRMALGAGRRQVVGQLLAEAAVLAIPAAGLGFAISRVTLDAGTRLLMSTFPPAYTAYLKLKPLEPDFRVYLFLIAMSVATTVLFGLAPALQVTRASVVAATRGDFEGGVRPSRLRNALVTLQVMGCVLLMAIAAILIRGSSQLERTDPGFDASGVLHIGFVPAQRATAIPTLKRLPGVSNVAGAHESPAQGMYSRVRGRVRGSQQEQTFYQNRVTPEFFSVLRIPLREGRTFSAAETAGGEPVVIVSETAARLIAPGRSALGAEIELTGDDEILSGHRLRRFRTARVVGVAGDAVPGLVIVSKASPIAYYPLLLDSAEAIMATAGGDEMRAAKAIETEIDRLHPGAVAEVSPLGQSVDAQIYPFRFASWISILLGVVTLLLTLSGIYGVLSYLVAQRTREIGIRMSLGAQTGSIVRMVLRQSLRLAALGAGIGLALALVIAKLFTSESIIVRALDPVAFLGTAVLALGACMLAAWIPSRRAAAVNPLEAIRSD